MPLKGDFCYLEWRCKDLEEVERSYWNISQQVPLKSLSPFADVILCLMIYRAIAPLEARTPKKISFFRWEFGVSQIYANCGCHLIVYFFAAEFWVAFKQWLLSTEDLLCQWVTRKVYAGLWKHLSFCPNSSQIGAEIVLLAVSLSFSSILLLILRTAHLAGFDSIAYPGNATSITGTANSLKSNALLYSCTWIISSLDVTISVVYVTCPASVAPCHSLLKPGAASRWLRLTKWRQMQQALIWPSSRQAQGAAQ